MRTIACASRVFAVLLALLAALHVNAAPAQKPKVLDGGFDRSLNMNNQGNPVASRGSCHARMNLELSHIMEDERRVRGAARRPGKSGNPSMRRWKILGPFLL
jgi:hypothetical protein